MKKGEGKGEKYHGAGKYLFAEEKKMEKEYIWSREAKNGEGNGGKYHGEGKIVAD